MQCCWPFSYFFLRNGSKHNSQYLNAVMAGIKSFIETGGKNYPGENVAGTKALQPNFNNNVFFRVPCYLGSLYTPCSC